MTAYALLAVALAAPFATALLLIAFARAGFVRDMIAVLGAAATFCVWAGAAAIAAGQPDTVLVVAALGPGLDAAFHTEPMGLAFAAAIAFVSLLVTVYAVGVRSAEADIGPVRFLAAAAIASGMACALAASQNLITLFVADLGLTMAGFALLAGVGPQSQARGAKTFLVLNLVFGVGLVLPAIVWAGALSGGFAFEVGGRFGPEADPIALNAMLALFVLGAAKAGPIGLAIWVRRSASAPAEALAVLTGAAVLGAGAFAILKLSLFLFGTAWISALWASKALLGLALAGYLWASLQALAERELAARLAYAGAAQAALVVSGALIGAPSAAFGALLHLIGFSLAQTALLLAIGLVRHATARTTTPELYGLGRRMPYTLAGFTLGALALAGMAPMAGAWARLWLSTGGVGAGLEWAAAAFVVGAALSFAYLVPLAARAMFEAPPATPFTRPDAIQPLGVGPILLAGLAAAALVVFADPIAFFVSGSLSAP